MGNLLHQQLEPETKAMSKIVALFQSIPWSVFTWVFIFGRMSIFYQPCIFGLNLEKG